MRIPVLHTRWFPIVLGVLTADVNFWYVASTSEKEADYAGIFLFAALGIYWLYRLAAAGEAACGVEALGAFAAVTLMILRETGAYDPGYIPPYAVFIVFVWAGGFLRR